MTRLSSWYKKCELGSQIRGQPGQHSEALSQGKQASKQTSAKKGKVKDS
jgi:hypothetical protein